MLDVFFNNSQKNSGIKIAFIVVCINAKTPCGNIIDRPSYTTLLIVSILKPICNVTILTKICESTALWKNNKNVDILIEK